jgi:hypothetical protein
MELFTATGKLKMFFFWQLETFDVYTTGYTNPLNVMGEHLISACTDTQFQ